MFLHPLFWPKTPPLRHVLPLAANIEMRIFRERFSKHWAHTTLYPGDVKTTAGFSVPTDHCIPSVTNTALNLLWLCLYVAGELLHRSALRIYESVSPS